MSHFCPMLPIFFIHAPFSQNINIHARKSSSQIDTAFPMDLYHKVIFCKRKTLPLSQQGLSQTNNSFSGRIPVAPCADPRKKKGEHYPAGPGTAKSPLFFQWSCHRAPPEYNRATSRYLPPNPKTSMIQSSFLKLSNFSTSTCCLLLSLPKFILTL